MCHKGYSNTLPEFLFSHSTSFQLVSFPFIYPLACYSSLLISHLPILLYCKIQESVVAFFQFNYNYQLSTTSL